MSTEETKSPATLALEAEVAKWDGFSVQLEDTRHQLGDVRAEIEQLSLKVCAGEVEPLTLAEQEERAGQLRATIRRLEAAIRGQDKHVQAARALLAEEDHEKAIQTVKAFMKEVSQLSRTFQPKLDEAMATLTRIGQLEDEALALAHKHGIVIRSKGPKRDIQALLRDRIARLRAVLPALLPILGPPGGRVVPEAEASLKETWRLES